MRLWRSRRAPHVVFIHAGGVDGRMWHPLAERLDGMRLHMPDLRGHGSTPLPPGEYAHADDLLRMLDDLRIKRATLVAASFGGWVALQLGMRIPAIPGIPKENDFGEVHELLVWVTLALVAIHVAAALYNQFVDRGPVANRMWPFRSTRDNLHD